MAATEETRPPGRVNEPPKPSSFIDNFLKSPFSGLAPWILMSVLSSPGRFEEAACAALGVSLLVMWLGRVRGIAIHQLEVFGVVVFAVYAVLGLVAPADVIRWLELWAGELTNIALAAFAAFTLLIRKPFTLAYAKETTPREHWDSPLFLRINYVITAVWAGAFFVSAVVGAIGDAVLHDPGNFWTGWVLQLAAIFAAVAFTEFYPDYATAKYPSGAGEPNEPPPSVARIFDWLPTFILVVGIYGWVTDTLPDAVGIGMIVVGVVGSAAMRKFFPTSTEPTGPQ
jgi:hypothetical protein